MTLQEKLTKLTQSHQGVMDFDLTRCMQVADKLNLRRWDIPVVIVAGTNGKGSVLAAMDAIYAEAGYRRLLYTSPHLQKLNERIVIDGVPIDDDLFMQAVSVVEQAAGDVKLTFFEWVTLAALQVAKQSTLDVLLLEIGMGGRLDAVNIVEPDVSIITSIALDHTEFLGDTREAIATEKAGVFRANGLAICGDPDVPNAIVARAAELNADLCCFQKDYNLQASEHGWSWRNARRQIDARGALHLKEQNIATAIQAVDLLDKKLPVTDQIIGSALSDLHLAGRMEQRRWRDRWFVFDVAHNPQATAEFSDQLHRLENAQGRTWAIFSVLASKDWQEMLKPMLGTVDEWLIPQLEGPRAAKLVDLEQGMQMLGIKNCRFLPSAAAALDVFLAESQPGDCCLVFGSFVTVGVVQAHMEDKSG